MKPHEKGDLTEATVITEPKRREIVLSMPFGDNERYDLTAESDGDLLRIQVKTGGSGTEPSTSKGVPTYERAREHV